MVAFTIVLGSHLLWFGYHTFAVEPGLLTVCVPIMIFEIFGISLVWFLLKGLSWARYTLAIYTSVGLFIVLFMPLAAHAHERTTLFFSCLAIVFLTFCYLNYLLLFNEKTKDILELKRLTRERG